MKKVSVIILSIVLFAAGCEKESVKIEKETLSEFDLKVIELEIGNEYHLETIVKNPNNEYESVGLLHNFGCDILTKKLSKHNFKASFDKEAFYKDVFALADNMNITITEGYLNLIPFELLYSKSEFIGDETLNQLVKDNLLTENVKNAFIELKQTVYGCSSLEEIQEQVIILENKYSNSNIMTESEKKDILVACSVLRYSSAYWLTNDLTSKNKGPVLAMFLADAAGAVIGGTASFGAGCVVGAAAASGLAAYVMQQ